MWINLCGPKFISPFLENYTNLLLGLRGYINDELMIAARSGNSPSQRNDCASALQETNIASRNKLTNIVLMVSDLLHEMLVNSATSNGFTCELYHTNRHPEIAITGKTRGKRHMTLLFVKPSRHLFYLPFSRVFAGSQYHKKGSR